MALPLKGEGMLAWSLREKMAARIIFKSGNYFFNAFNTAKLIAFTPVLMEGSGTGAKKGE